MEIEIILSKKLSKPFDNRYIIIDKETQKILDDAQGYGYKTKQKAYAFWSYQHRDKNKTKKEKLILNWLKKNKSFTDILEEYTFYLVKINEKPDESIVEAALRELNLQAPSNNKDIFNVWSKGHI